jgi:hypothetical protein
LSASSPKVDPKAVPVILVPGPDGVAGLQATTEVAGLAGTVPAGGSLVARMAEIPGVAPYVLTAGDPSHWVGDDDGTGPALADAIDCLRTGGRKVAVVAVSTGGLAARWAFSKADDAAARAGATALVTTLGTPFDGSYAIGLAKTLGADNPPFVPNALDNPRRASLVLQAALADLATCPAAGGEEQHVKPACRRLDVLAALAGPLAEALTPGSTQLRSLPAWPRGVPVLQLAGHALVSDGKQRVDIGDGIASTASALAGAPRGAVHSCPTATAGGAGPLSCWNSDLPVLTEAVDDAVGAVRAVAHPTVTGFFGEGGSGVVEDGRILSQLPIRPEHTGFTADGRYFVVLGNSKLTVLDIDTQVVRDVSCDCFGFAIVGRQVYVDTYSGPMVAFGVPDLRSRPVPVAGVGQATYVQPIGASGEKLILEVLRNAGAANGQPAVLTVAPDGARSTEVPLPAPSATYQVYPTSPTTAVALNSSHASACSYYDMASTVDFRTGKSAYIDGTAFAGIGPSLGPEPPVGVDYVSLTDLHRGRDGKMYVTARSGRCDDQQIQTDTIQPSLFRLDGTRWVRAAAGTIGPTRDFGAAGRWSLSGLVGGGGGQRLSWSHAGTVSYPREGVDSLVSPPAQDVL